MAATGAHLVWDWNGTLLDDLSLVVDSTNRVFASVGGAAVPLAEHRVRYRRPVADYYADVLGRPVTEEEFGRLDVDADDALVGEYSDRVPVLLLDGREHGYWRVDEERLLRDLERPPGAPPD